MILRILTLHCILLFVWLGFFPQDLSALLPPQIHHSIPDNGDMLYGNTVRLIGYSLSPAMLENLEVIDLTTNIPVETSSDLNCQWEGEASDDMLGCEQLKCNVSVALREVIAGHQYELSIENLMMEDNLSAIRFFSSAESIGNDLDHDGITDKQGDCNDNDAEIFPGAIERCGDDIDRDCNGFHTVCCNGSAKDDTAGCFILSAQ